MITLNASILVYKYRPERTQNFGPIGSAVLTFIGYKQTNRQTDKLNLYIDEDFKTNPEIT